jgi:hypothetical protein
MHYKQLGNKVTNDTHMCIKTPTPYTIITIIYMPSQCPFTEGDTCVHQL